MSRTAATGKSPANRGMQSRTPPGQRHSSSQPELALYLIAAVTYIAVGFVRQEVFAWWSYGAVWVVAVIWFVPPLIRRLMNRLRPQAQPERDAD